MAEPSPKRLKSGLPFCTIHRQGRALSMLVKQNFPAVVEEGLCGVTSALLEAAYVFQMLGEIFDQFDTALPNVSKFFLDRSKEEREAAEALIQYQHDRGGIYCTRVIQKPPNVSINGVATALEVALVQWKTLASYFEELYALSIKNSDPHTASTIKKQFLAPKIERIKLMGDLITNTHRLRSAQDGKSNLENYLIDRLQEELKLSPDSEGHRSLCVPLRKGRAAVEKLQLVQEIFPQHNNNVKPKCPGLHCFPSQPRWKGLREADRRQEHKWY
ncbi:Ferritin light chain [Varanus komodoensis]|uniref:Ferritin n=1 Tax=Varanus komodoensis TaxID=61221 RepID=A0A8D2JE94_VARKO|nr:ferritin light chain-like [Varanus komodoensis]KAF7245427.1 Ferritin light chain [Varanus komodoensis]